MNNGAISPFHKYCNYQYLVGHYPIIYPSSHVFLKFHITTQSNKNPIWNPLKSHQWRLFFLVPIQCWQCYGQRFCRCAADDTCCRWHVLPFEQRPFVQMDTSKLVRNHAICGYLVKTTRKLQFLWAIFHRIYQMVSYLFLDKSNW